MLLCLQTQHMLKEHLRVADANVSYRERVYMGIDQLQRQTYMNREPSGS